MVTALLEKISNIDKALEKKLLAFIDKKRGQSCYT